MPDGSSSEAPVTSPGPSAPRYVRRLIRDDEGFLRPRRLLVVAFFARSVPTHAPRTPYWVIPT